MTHDRCNRSTVDAYSSQTLDPTSSIPRDSCLSSLDFLSFIGSVRLITMNYLHLFFNLRRSIQQLISCLIIYKQVFTLKYKILTMTHSQLQKKTSRHLSYGVLRMSKIIVAACIRTFWKSFVLDRNVTQFLLEYVPIVLLQRGTLILSRVKII